MGLGLLFVLVGFRPVDDTYRIIAPPEWVTLTSVQDPGEGPVEQITNGLYIVLVDHQVQAASPDISAFSHEAYKVVNAQGVESAAHVSVDYDPIYQQLDLHFVRIRRNGDVLDRLNPARLSVLQRETDLEYQIYDGTQTVALILEDVRVGDIVEYAYTLHGENPIFEGRFSSNFRGRIDAPVHQLRYRLLMPANQPLFIKNHGIEVQPVQRRRGHLTEYTWALQDLDALSVDSDLPVWYDPYPWVQMSTWESWAEVVAWGRRLFERSHAGSEALRTEIAALASASAVPEERVTAALRFVQDEIRYMGIEIGTSSHKPSLPAEVLQRRFGDCKDKTLLLVTILRELGIDAWPALVNTRDQHLIATWQPTPDAFDHAIVHVRLGDAVYWLDPTEQYQRGVLEDLVQPDYGVALILRAGEHALTPFEWHRPDAPSKEVVEVFDLQAGVGEAATYTVTTTLRRHRADNMRAMLAWQSRQELEKSYLNYYATLYPSIEQNEGLVIQDDEAHNVIEVIESYVIPDFWERDGASRTATFFPMEINELLVTPSTSQRTMPLYVPYPVRQVLTTDVMLPESWMIEPERVVIEDSAFTFEQRVSYAERTLTMRYTFRTHADHVPAEQARLYLENLKRVEDQIGYQLYKMDDATEATGPVNWLLMIIALIVLGLALYAAHRVYAYDPAAEPLPPEARDKRYQGLGGWLILVGLSLILHPIMMIVTLRDLLLLFDQEVWLSLTSPSSGLYHPLYAPLFLFEVVANTGWLVFSILLIVLFFQRRQSFPRIFVAVLIGGWLILLIDYVGAAGIPGAGVAPREIAELVRGFFHVVIWTAYMHTSKRVESTFVERRTPVLASAPTESTSPLIS